MKISRVIHSAVLTLMITLFASAASPVLASSDVVVSPANTEKYLSPDANQLPPDIITPWWDNGDGSITVRTYYSPSQVKNSVRGMNSINSFAGLIAQAVPSPFKRIVQFSNIIAQAGIGTFKAAASQNRGVIVTSIINKSDPNKNRSWQTIL